MHPWLAGRRGPALLIVLHLLMGQAFILATPPWEAPDEPWHLAYAEALAAGHLPTAEETYEHHHPPLYYLWPALGLHAIGLHGVERAPYNPRYPFAAAAYLHPPGAPDEAPMRLLRGLSGLFGALAVALTWAAARRAARGRSDAEGLAFLTAGLVAALPQLAAVTHAISNDGLATVAGAGLLYALLRWADFAVDSTAGGALRAGLGLGAWLVLALLTKLNALALIAALPPALLLVAFHAGSAVSARSPSLDANGPALRTSGRAPTRRLPRRPLVHAGLALFVVASTLVAALVLLRWALPSVATSLVDNLVGRGVERDPALSDPRAILLQTGLMLDQVWGRYGWFNVIIPVWMRRLADLVALLALAGLPFAWRDATSRYRSVLVISMFLVGVALAAGVRNLLSDPQPQARLLFPGLPAAALLLATGWSAGSRRLPARPCAAVAIAPIIGLIALGLYATQLRLPEAFAPARRPARPLATRLITPDWEIVARLGNDGALAVQTIRGDERGLARIELPVLVASGPGRLDLRLYDAASETLIAQADWPLDELGRPDVDRPRIGPLADASWPGLDLPSDRVSARELRLELGIEGEGRAWLPGTRDGTSYPEGALVVDGEPRSDLLFVSLRAANASTAIEIRSR